MLADMLIDEGLELLTEDQCGDLLASQSFGRVGVTVGGLPVIMPVNYAFVDGTVVFRSGPGTKLRAVSAGAVIAFEIDAWDSANGTGWSVLAVGRAEEIEDQGEIDDLDGRAPHPAADGLRTHYVRLRPELMTGRRIAS
jgi:nitroimidazol reductase NimA-like FMN-containing flavoprotein (pyridoxamine 5'-phosphate oxidase superfamily)